MGRFFSLSLDEREDPLAGLRDLLGRKHCRHDDEPVFPRAQLGHDRVHVDVALDELSAAGCIWAAFAIGFIKNKLLFFDIFHAGRTGLEWGMQLLLSYRADCRVYVLAAVPLVGAAVSLGRRSRCDEERQVHEGRAKRAHGRWEIDTRTFRCRLHRVCEQVFTEGSRTRRPTVQDAPLSPATRIIDRRAATTPVPNFLIRRLLLVTGHFSHCVLWSFSI